ncbi:hypothetical protein TNCV_2484301 [Trichonephila clavipes]|uniref:Uncharacterized protein n=1 Tax=Trichonephila clavipes TaxID=2585209 RepID=A0A8X6VZB9_TRICX|nr:hypothetical protein TNCV_2484301 [Trichonephila clavipes]
MFANLYGYGSLRSKRLSECGVRGTRTPSTERNVLDTVGRNRSLERFSPLSWAPRYVGGREETLAMIQSIHLLFTQHNDTNSINNAQRFPKRISRSIANRSVTSVMAIAVAIGGYRSSVHYVLQREDLHPYHFQSVASHHV